MIDVDGIKTYSNKQALDELAKLARRVPPGQSIVEIGVYRGGSLRTIAKAAAVGVPVYGVDTWGIEGAYESGSENAEKYGSENLSIARKAVAGLEHVTLVRNFSTEAAWHYTGPAVGLLYVDGEHTRDAVLADFHAWRPYLAPDATIVFDDYRPTHPGVVDAVDDLIRKCLLDYATLAAGRLAICRRPQPA